MNPYAVSQAQFERANEAMWARFNADTSALLKRAAPPGFDPELYALRYRTVCKHLALAQGRGYSPSLVAYLADLASKGHGAVYDNPVSLRRRFWRWFSREAPFALRDARGYVLAAHALFYIPMIAVALLCYVKPPLAYSVVGPEAIAGAEAAFAEYGRHYAQMESAEFSELFMMFGYYALNNIGIAFRVLVSSIALLLPLLIVSLSNSADIGATMGYLSQTDSAFGFWAFVCSHSAFELTGITLSIAGGMMIGTAFFRRDGRTLSQSLRFAGRRATPLLSLSFLLLFVAALIEGFWSNQTSIWAPLRYALAAASWLFALYYVFFARAGRKRPERWQDY